MWWRFYLFPSWLAYLRTIVSQFCTRMDGSLSFCVLVLACCLPVELSVDYWSRRFPKKEFNCSPAPVVVVQNNIMNHQQLSSTLFRSLHLMASVFRPEELFSSSCCEWRIYWTVPRWMLWLRKYNYFIPGRFTFHSIEVTVDWRSHSVGPLPYDDDDAVAISFTCVWLSALHLLAISLSALLAPQSIQPSILNLSSARPSAQEPKESSTMILRALFQF